MSVDRLLELGIRVAIGFAWCCLVVVAVAIPTAIWLNSGWPGGMVASGVCGVGFGCAVWVGCQLAQSDRDYEAARRRRESGSPSIPPPTNPDLPDVERKGG